MVEWSILALVIVLLAATFGYYAQRVQGQAERATVVATVGALRATLVLEHLHQAVAPPVRAVPPNLNNPFTLLQALPTNYAGQVANRDVSQVVAGSWVFDAGCGCVGYKPLRPEWLEQPAGVAALWFRESRLGGVPQLDAMDSYIWQGLPVN